MSIRNLIACACLIFAASVSVAQESITAVFDWSKPESLDPAFRGPESGDKIGVNLDGAVFTSRGVKFRVDDSRVSEGSRKARFYWAYLTDGIELRAYMDTDIIITAPEGMAIQSVSFTGPQADSDSLTPCDTSGAWSGATWTAGTDASEVSFYVPVRCELTTTAVTCKAWNAVGSIAADPQPGQWYDLSGRPVTGRPSVPGVYLLRRGTSVTRHLVH